jgi:hypothetical protein
MNNEKQKYLVVYDGERKDRDLSPNDAEADEILSAKRIKLDYNAFKSKLR